MEIALGRAADPDLVLSLPLGAGRLTRAMLPHDPPKRGEVKALRRYVRETLGEVVDRLRWESVPRNVVATSKTFKQLARLAGAPPQREGPFVRRTLTVNDVRDWIPRLAGMSAAHRTAGSTTDHHRREQSGDLGALVHNGQTVHPYVATVERMFALLTGYSVIPNPRLEPLTREGVVVMAHVRRLVDVRTGDEFDQPVPFGLVYPVCTADGSAPPSQRGRTWEHLVASDRELRPVS